jgi:hypothetical protein
MVFIIMKKTIKHISYFKSGSRKIVESQNDGTFRFIYHYETASGLKSKYKNFTAWELIYHKDIVNNDPVLTMLTGEKIRVFPGGDPSYLPAMVEGTLNKNDRREKLKRKLERQKKKRSLLERNKKGSKADNANPSDTDEYDNPFYWPGN